MVELTLSPSTSMYIDKVWQLCLGWHIFINVLLIIYSTVQPIQFLVSWWHLYHLITNYLNAKWKKFILFSCTNIYTNSLPNISKLDEKYVLLVIFMPLVANYLNTGILTDLLLYWSHVYKFITKDIETECWWHHFITKDRNIGWTFFTLMTLKPM